MTQSHAEIANLTSLQIFQSLLIVCPKTFFSELYPEALADTKSVEYNLHQFRS